MDIKLKYLWKFFVFFIFVYYLNGLTKRSKKAVHTSSIKKLSENPSILFCVSLRKKCSNVKVEIDNFKVSKFKNETMQKLICHIKNNLPKNPKYIIEEAKKWNFFDAFDSKLNNTIKKNIILYNFKLCANYDLILNSKKRPQTFKFSINNIFVKTFLYPAEQINLFFGLGLFTFDFNESASYVSYLFIKQVKILNANYEKACIFKKKQVNLLKCSKLYCYQQCFKNKINSFKFLYTEKDNFLIKKDDENTNPINLKCLHKCYKNFHGTYYYLKEIKFKNKISKTVKFIFDPTIQVIVPRYLMSGHIFMFEVTSLLGVLLGFNYLNFLFNCLSESKKLLRLNKDVLIKKIEFLIIFFTTANLLINCSRLIKNYRNNSLINTSTSTFSLGNTPFSVSVCFNIKTIISKHKNNLVDLVDPIEKNNIFSLETYTFNFDSLFNESYIKFVSLKTKVEIDSKKVQVFYMSEWQKNDLSLNIYKCFFIYVNVTQSLIQNLLEISFINFKFNEEFIFYYLTAKDLYPNSETYKIYPNAKYKIHETVLNGDQSIFDCKVYNKKCFSQKECIDECFVLNYLDEFSKLPSDIPILPKWYDRKWYKLLTFHFQKIDKTAIYKKFKDECFEAFPLKDCHQKKYKPSKSYKNATKSLSIFLHDTIKTKSKVILLNKYELITNILTSINIWLGFNMPKIMQNCIFKITKLLSIFYYDLVISSTLNKAFRLLFKFLSFIGLIYSLFVLINSIKKENKITNVKYTLLPEIEYPFITICKEYQKVNLSKNLKLSGNLLDELTFSANDIFQSISYLDGKFSLKEETEFNKLEFNGPFRTLELSHFYFMRLKCFRLKYNVKIPFYYFYKKKNETSYLTIKLKSNVTEYFLTLSTYRSYNFNHYKKMKKQKNIIYFFKITVENRDLYTFLKDFFLFFRKDKSVNFNEGVSYSKFIKKKFKESKNFSTLLLPLGKNYFNLTINDEEYLKFYETEMVKLEKQNIDNNYLREHYMKVYSHFENSIDNEIKFRPKLLSPKTIISDKIPVELFVLTVLNIISFWFDISLISIIDQTNSLLKMFYYHISFFVILISLKIKKKCSR